MYVKYSAPRFHGGGLEDGGKIKKGGAGLPMLCSGLSTLGGLSVHPSIVVIYSHPPCDQF